MLRQHKLEVLIEELDRGYLIHIWEKEHEGGRVRIFSAAAESPRSVMTSIIPWLVSEVDEKTGRREVDLHNPDFDEAMSVLKGV